MIDVLADGQPHFKKELFDCIEDPEAGPGAVAAHLHLLRKKLRPMGEDVICELKKNRFMYRRIRIVKFTD